MIRKNKYFSFKRFKTDFLQRYRWQLLIFLSLIIVPSVFFPRGKSLQFTYQKDDIARETVIAPYTFPILKPDAKLEEDLDEALNSEPALFIRNQEIVDGQLQSIDQLFTLIGNIQAVQNNLTISANKVFRLRYEDTYQQAVSEFKADSVQLLSLIENFKNDYSFDSDSKN